MPASNARALEKAKAIPADALIFDLEDAVAPTAKLQARAAARAALDSGDYGARPLIVRINALDTPWGSDDLAALAGSNAHALLVPKITSADAAQQMMDQMDRLGFAAACQLWCMIEMPAAILNIGAIAALAPGSRLTAFALGFNDLAKEMGVPLAAARALFQPVMLQVALAGHACGVTLLDSVFNDFADEAGLRAECAQARDLGFAGKTLIHPAQVAIANAAFAPSEGEIAQAQAIVAAFAAPEHSGKGAIQLDGTMVERLHLEQAQALLARVAPSPSTKAESLG
jgi:citrate lyase subunit beta/citryl-CoA lyase